MRLILCIVSCHALAARRQAIRETWLPLVPREMDCKFFLGRGQHATLQPDEIVLDVDDSYRGLPAKTKAIARWALAHGYSYLCKCDDDVYVQPDRLLASEFAKLGNYVGRKRGPSGGQSAPYASGFCYWLSNFAMKALIDAPLTDDPAEDRWVGNSLLAAGIECAADYRYVVINSTRCAVSHTEGPRKGNTVISACEFNPEKMRQTHKEWLTLTSGDDCLLPDGPFAKVCVLVKTFLRDGYLLRTIEGLQKNLPSAKIVIVDDGRESNFKISWYAKLRRLGHICRWMPFDSGFGAKANDGVRACDRPYVLIASDDFNFEDSAAAEGVLKMVEILDQDPQIAVASGRVNGNPYEATLELKGSECIERKGVYQDQYGRGVVHNSRYYVTDLTVNYSLIRREVFNEIKWDEDVKIGGGEHGAFYIDLKRAGFKVAWVEGVNINELHGTTDWSSVEYHKYRARARQPGRICLKRRGIDRYHLMGGEVELT